MNFLRAGFVAVVVIWAVDRIFDAMKDWEFDKEEEEDAS